MRDLIDKTKSLYEIDEYQWMLDQISMLEAKKYESIDYGNLLLYLTEMASRERRELKSRFVVLLHHMLKFLMQPSHATTSWVMTVLEQQRQIKFSFDDTPSLKNYSVNLFSEAYPYAVKEASRETKIPHSDFPKNCPWTIEQVLDYDPPEV